MSLDEVQQKYGINATKEYAQQQAQAKLQKQLEALGQTRKEYEGSAYSESRKKDLDYFDQFRQQQYNTAGRGLAGGLEKAGQQQLNIARNQDLADIYSTLQTRNANLDTQGRQYSDEATTYADQLYQQNLGQARQYIEADYSRKFQEAQAAFERKMAEQQMALSRAAASRSTAKTPLTNAEEQAEILNMYNQIAASGGTVDDAMKMAQQSGYKFDNMYAVLGGTLNPVKQSSATRYQELADANRNKTYSKSSGNTFSNILKSMSYGGSGVGGSVVNPSIWGK